MASVSEVPTGVAKPAELNLLLIQPPRRSAGSWLLIGVTSATCQALLLFFCLQLATIPGAETEPQRAVIVHRTPLYFPPQLLTQRERNRTRPASEVSLADLMARRAAAAAAAGARHFKAPNGSPGKPAQTPQIQPPDLPVTNGPAQLPLGTTAGLAPPAAPPATETSPPLRKPTTSVQSAIQSLSQDPAARRTVVADDSNSRPRLGAPASNGQAGTQHVDVELKSDADAPDFRNYLIRVLSIVRRNWRLVTPESVRLGTLRGENTIDLIINRDGSIPKLVIGDSATVDALDRASVAGVSMSNPLPPLPDDFKGQQVRLTFTFKYNMPQ
jgi:TonB family protein